VSPRFAEKTAIVTGASRGIGLAVAQRLVGDGARVVITARTKEALDEAVERLGGPRHALGVAGKADNPVHQDEAIQHAISRVRQSGLPGQQHGH
jgi:NAD(P)-dependent dehydrogenase (short-subunit alcohol dehydrogenase family)